MFRVITFLFICVSSLVLFGDSFEELLLLRPAFPARTLQEQQAESLNDRAERIGAWETAYGTWLTQVAEVLKLEMRIDFSSEDSPVPHVIRLVDVDDEGNPVYEGTENVNAAISTQARSLRRGLLGLEGENEIAAIWDFGNVLSTHQEFSDLEGGSRVTVRDGVPASNHGTHVGGTIGAGGTDPDAIGMAPFVLIESWDAESGLSEATAHMAGSFTDFSNPAISNHSYGRITGWNLRKSDGSPDEDKWHWESFAFFNQHEGFGLYGKTAQQWDELVYRNPSYLHIRSAGNDRDDGPADGDTVYYKNPVFGTWDEETYDHEKQPLADRDYKGGYDTIPTDKMAKNILTVGAVADAVDAGLRDPNLAVPTGFSSFGPADDGRVKPDVVANGAGVYSSIQSADDDYASYGGTSMAAPNVTGTAILLQQLARKVFEPSRRLYADELKGLLIHTADDLMNAGPDYQVGWGLVNGISAAYLLQVAPFGRDNSRFISDYLSLEEDAEPIEITFELDVVGTVDLKATLCWSDPAGGTRGDDSRDPVLRHDLDLRIFGPDDQIFRPFILDPEKPADTATTGDNVVDNVEQVIAKNLGAGTYTIRVSAKAVDTGVEQQGFSLWVSPVLDPLAVTIDQYESSAAGTSFTQKIYAEGDWLLSSTAPWLSSLQTGGSGADEIQMDLAPNLTNQARSAIAYITATNDRGQIGFRVTQEALGEVTLAEALDQPDLTFTPNGTTSWFGQNVFHNGDGDGAVITNLPDGESSSFSLQFEGPGEVFFDYDVDSEINDYFRFKLNGSIFVLESGVDHEWRSARFPLNDGNNTLVWEYTKDGGGTAGGDYAAVDRIRFSRLLPAQTQLNVPALGAEETVTVTLENPVSPNNTWSVRNASTWLEFAETSFTNSGTVQVKVHGNFQLADRQGSFEMGNDRLGWHLITIDQTGQEAHLLPDDTFEDFPFTFTQDEDDVPWFGLEDFLEDGNPALVASGLESGERAILETTLQGPGFLYFGVYRGFSFGTENDYFGFSINGVYTRVRGSGRSSFISTEYHRFVIPEGTHELTFEFYFEGGISYDETAAIQDLSFFPGSLDMPPVIPAQGIVSSLDLDVPAGTNWELRIPNEESRVRLNEATVSGSGATSVPVTFLANTFPTNRLDSLFLRFPDQGTLSEYEIPFTPEAFTPSAIAEALDQPDLVFVVSSNDPDDPSNALIQGQDALTNDGRDALVLGPETPSGGNVSTSITGPAVVSFDYFMPEGLSSVVFFSVPEISFNTARTSSTSEWETVSFEIPDGVTATPKWRERDRGYLYIDRLRITRPEDLDQGVTQGRQGGTLVLPLPEENVTPVSSETWAQVAVVDGRLEITFAPLPQNLKSRTGSVTVGASTIDIMQLDRRAVEPAYLAEVGATDSDALFNDPLRQPLGDLDGDGDRNWVEWVFYRPPGLQDKPVYPGASGMILYLRDSPWVIPVLEESTQLPGLLPQPLLRSGGLWTQTGTLPLLQVESQTAEDSEVDRVTFTFPLPLPARYFYRPSAMGR